MKEPVTLHTVTKSYGRLCVTFTACVYLPNAAGDALLAHPVVEWPGRRNLVRAPLLEALDTLGESFILLVAATALDGPGNVVRVEAANLLRCFTDTALHTRVDGVGTVHQSSAEQEGRSMVEFADVSTLSEQAANRPTSMENNRIEERESSDTEILTQPGQRPKRRRERGRERGPS